MPLVPNLPGWYQTLLQDKHKSDSTIKTYQATVRSAYNTLLQTNTTAKYLDSLFLDAGLSPQQRRHRIRQTMEQLVDALDPGLTPTTTAIRSHLANRVPILSPDQIWELILAPDVSTLRGRRDAAALALLACTGIHPGQLVNLDVGDLYQRIDEMTPALCIRFLDKQRLIPFGELIKARELAYIWHTSAGLSAGPLFVQLEPGNHLPSEYAQPARLTHNSVIRILRAYPVTNCDGSRLVVSCRDLRHTYIQSLRQIGIEAISLYKEVDYSYTGSRHFS